MREKIFNKLRLKLDNQEFSESDVVYIFSLIRKLYELDGKLLKQNEIAFYCNWSLHTEIEDTKAVSSVLEGLCDGSNYEFIGFEHFVKIMKEYLEDNNLPLRIVTEDKVFVSFRHALVNIYTDTPLKIKGKENRILTIKNVDSGDIRHSFGIHFEIK